MNYFTAKENFEKLSLNPFSTKDLLLDEDIVPDTNIFNDKRFQKLNSTYYTPDELSFGKNFFQDNFSVFHLNVISMDKNFYWNI